MEKRIVVTTSWDDGFQADMRLAELLQSRGMTGTFYVPIIPYCERPSLDPSQLRALSTEGFEIGAHGFSHKLLWNLSTEELAKEISPCKPILQDILGTEVRMFCYPKGRYDSNVVRALKKAGYCGARTVRMLAMGAEFDPFEMPTTLQGIPQPRLNYVKNVVRSRKMEAARVCFSNMSRLGNWVELGKALFDSVLENGGIWHLYGHSYEIDELSLWTDLEEILNYICGREQVMYVPNCELIRLFPQNGAGGNGKL
jgi:peptidoglycan-N-acetylglucosamine deacetylase